jgi:predicted TIM-barrel fold metal-dependent hydrolase
VPRQPEPNNEPTYVPGDDGLEPALATTISRAYNDWLAEFCAGGSDRMFGAGMIPPSKGLARFVLDAT